MIRLLLEHVWLSFLFLIGVSAVQPLPSKYWCSDLTIAWADCGIKGGVRMMEEIPGITTPMPHWYENFRPYVRQCPSCTPIWLLCPSEDTGGWDGGDMLRLGGRTALEMINKQQKLLPGYELMCEWYNDHCTGITGQRIVTGMTSANPSKYVGIGTAGCSGVCKDIASYTPYYNMPMMSWAAGMPDLTDRTVYPNFFRTRIPHTAFTFAWLRLAKICNWTKFAVFMAEEGRFRGHFELQLKEIVIAGGKVVFQAQITKPTSQADTIMATMKKDRFRIMTSLTYETTWRALMCSAFSLGMRDLVWLVFGFYNKGWYGIHDTPPLQQWKCGTAELRMMGHTAIMATTTMWAPKPEVPFYCDYTGKTTANTFKAAYLKAAADELTSAASVKLGGRDYRVNPPRDAGAQAADGACMYAEVLSKLLGLHPKGKKVPSGNTYTLAQLLARSPAVYEDTNQALQSTEFDGVSGSPFRFACEGYPKNGKACDAKCRNSLKCTGDGEGAAILFQFNMSGNPSDGSELPTSFQYNRDQELGAKTQAGRDAAFIWYKPIAFHHGAYWGGDKAKMPAGVERATCVAGYHHVPGTKFCVPDDMFPLCPPGQALVGAFCVACAKHHYFDVALNTCRHCAAGTMQMIAGKTTCDRCPKGYFSNATVEECAPCTKGTYAAGTGSISCEACEAGTVAPMSKTVNCQSCPPGSYQGQVGQSACKVCNKGNYSSVPGWAACLPCALGYVTAVGNSTRCTPCAQGFFQDGMGKQVCKKCPSQQTTLLLGAQGSDECRCVKDFYRQDPQSECQPCGKGMTCPFGSDMSIYKQWNENGRSEKGLEDTKNTFPRLDSRYTSTAADPLSVFVCKSDLRCPGGPPGTCGPQLLTDVGSCAHCEENWYWTGGECMKCNDLEVSSVLYPALPLMMGPIIVCFMYFMFRDDIEKWGSWQNGCAAMGFILLNHLQIISLGSSTNIQYPSNMGDWFGAFSFSDDTVSVFKPQCAGFANFEKTMISRSLGPVVMALIFLLVYLVSQPVGKFTELHGMKNVAMNFDRTSNIFFSVILTFFAGIVAMCITIFKCHDNPNGKRTLAKDESIICGDDKWTGMLGISIVSVLVYVLGFGCLCSYVIYVAPKRFSDIHFQRRWKFLFIKYRPDVWWWTLAFCVKGFMMNLGFIFLDQGIAQILWILAISIVYVGVAMFANPWRHRAANFFEVYSHMVMLAVIAIMIWFAHDSAEDPKQVDNDLSFFLILVNAHLITIFVAMVYQIRKRKSVSLPESERSLQAMTSLGKLDNEAFNKFVNQLNEWDLWYIFESTEVIRVEYMGIDGGRTRASPHNNAQSQFSSDADADPPPPPQENVVPKDKQFANAVMQTEAALTLSSGDAFDIPPDLHASPQCSPRSVTCLTSPRAPATPPMSPRTPVGSPRG